MNDQNSIGSNGGKHVIVQIYSLGSMIPFRERCVEWTKKICSSHGCEHLLVEIPHRKDAREVSLLADIKRVSLAHVIHNMIYVDTDCIILDYPSIDRCLSEDNNGVPVFANQCLFEYDMTRADSFMFAVNGNTEWFKKYLPISLVANHASRKQYVWTDKTFRTISDDGGKWGYFPANSYAHSYISLNKQVVAAQIVAHNR